MSVIALWGPPHCGKTALSIHLAQTMALHGQSVCLVSTAPYSELTVRMNLKITEEKSLTRAYQMPGHLKEIVQEAGELLYVLSVPWDYDAFAENVTGDTARELLPQLDAMFDCVLVDCASCGNEVLTAWGLNLSQRVLLLSGATPTAALWHYAFRKAITALESKTLFGVSRIVRYFDYTELCHSLEREPQFSIPYHPHPETEQITKSRSFLQAVRKLYALTEALP